MKQVVIKGGTAEVIEVPAPRVGQKNILVQVAYSCVSAGTEMASVQNSAMPLYKRALAQPANVKRVVELAKSQGIARTISRVQSQLSSGTPSGYSAAGTVVELGAEVEGFSLGDRVACAGAGIANHAEFIDVPVNLAVPVPDSVGLDTASSVTLGAIAMQGVRRSQPTLGETFVVVGLGILGQITAQLLSANGCRVIGTDLDPGRIAVAVANGLDDGIDGSAENYVDKVMRLTDGFGADGVIVTAASASDKVISDAMNACRKKGRVVLVGDVGLALNRADFYKKELDFLISASYGPGRYDPVYEEGGQDYPLAYVRWTENRNMQAYIQLLSSGRINVSSLGAITYPVDRASDAYNALKSEANRPLLTLLKYEGNAETPGRTVRMTKKARPDARIRIALVGASSFAQGMHLPNIQSLKNDFEVRAVMSRTGSTARSVATQYAAAFCTTEFSEILADDATDLVMITTRHNLHGSLALEALRAGKNVFVEKPLTLYPEELAEIEKFYAGSATAPLLMVGYNRRFSPAIAHVQSLLAGSTTPLIADYRMNAGFLPKEHWVHGPEGGGRNLGEACHIYDVFAALTGGSREEAVTAYSVKPRSAQWARNDNFVAAIKYESGSVCSLTYTAQGSKEYPKERMEIFADGKVIVMDDYKSVEVYGSKQKGWSSRSVQKGQLEELRALADTLRRGKPWPISLQEQLSVSRISFDVESRIAAGLPTRVGDET